MQHHQRCPLPGRQWVGLYEVIVFPVLSFHYNLTRGLRQKKTPIAIKVLCAILTSMGMAPNMNHVRVHNLYSLLCRPICTSSTLLGPRCCTPQWLGSLLSLLLSETLWGLRSKLNNKSCQQSCALWLVLLPDVLYHQEWRIHFPLAGLPTLRHRKTGDAQFYCVMRTRTGLLRKERAYLVSTSKKIPNVLLIKIGRLPGNR